MPEQTAVVGALLGLHAQTALHPGSGTALGTVDLPVQRERHTQFPTIAGSALKGILRDACRSGIARVTGSNRREADESEELTIVFGPPTGSSSEFAGALSVTDARLLAYPVRSLKGVFAWVTCSLALDRLRRDAALAGFSVQVPDAPKLEPAANRAAVANGSPLLIDNTQLVLEEFDFAREPNMDPIPVAKWMADTLLPKWDEYSGMRTRFQTHLVVLHDDDFTHFVRHATEVMARTALDYHTKTVSRGALFYQEFLPGRDAVLRGGAANPARSRPRTGTPARCWRR